MSRLYDVCVCGARKQTRSDVCAECAREAAGNAADAWIEAIAAGIEREKDETGRPFVVQFAEPPNPAACALLASLGVTIAVDWTDRTGGTT